MSRADQPSDPTGVAASHGSDDPRLERWEERFFWPVLLAAVASVPAVFLTVLAEGPWGVAGEAINHLSLAVFAAETVVLLVLARDKRRWVREHWVIVAITALAVPAVILALGPVQVLRVLVQGYRMVGALRIIRVGRILKAGKILYNRTDVSGPVRKGIAAGATLLAAAFVAVVLVGEEDPQVFTVLSEARVRLEEWFGAAWVLAVVLAGLLLAGATFVVARRRLAELRGGGAPAEEAAEQRDRSQSAGDASDPDDARGRA